MNKLIIDADVIVIGGGAAGMMAAGHAAELGARVLLLEKTDHCGKKILISGKTRCNLTNTADIKNFIAMYGANGRFLHGAFARFFRPELLSFLGKYGLDTKAERGGRVFPVSDDARDVVRVFQKYLADYSVRIVYSARVSSVSLDQNSRFAVGTVSGRYLPGPSLLLPAVHPGRIQVQPATATPSVRRLATQSSHPNRPWFPWLSASKPLPDPCRAYLCAMSAPPFFRGPQRVWMPLVHRIATMAAAKRKLPGRLSWKAGLVKCSLLISAWADRSSSS